MPREVAEHSGAMPRCARHPGVETALTCATCGTPICPDCMVVTPVGMKCPACGTAPVPRIYRVGPGALAVAVAVAAALGTLAGAFLFVWRLGFFAVFLGPFVGGLIGEAASRAAGWKRGRMIATASAVACGIGIVLLGPQVAVTLASGSVSAAPAALALLVYRPFFLLFAGIAVTAAFWRTR